MTRERYLETLREAERSPGFRGYAFQAAVWCADCVRAMAEEGKFDAVLAGATDDDVYGADTDTLPMPAFFPESDTAEHCDACGEYLYGPEPDDDDDGGEEA